jgi:hypothetical protein
LVARGDYSSIANSLTKITVIFRRIWEVLGNFKNVYVFIPRFLAEPLTMLCGALVEKQRPIGDYFLKYNKIINHWKNRSVKENFFV